MKPINISTNQKDKLIEMCRKLFPDYRWHIEGILIEMFSGMNDAEIYEDEIPIETFHWFEFCVTKLYNEFKRRAIDIDLYFFTLNPEHCQWPKEYNHPIDYLYFKVKERNS